MVILNHVHFYWSIKNCADEWDPYHIYNTKTSNDCMIKRQQFSINAAHKLTVADKHILHHDPFAYQKKAYMTKAFPVTPSAPITKTKKATM